MPVGGGARDHDDLLQVGESGQGREDLVDLLLVGDHQDARPRVAEHVGHLLRGGVGRQREVDDAVREAGDVGERRLERVLGQDGDPRVALSGGEREQPSRDGAGPPRQVGHAELGGRRRPGPAWPPPGVGLLAGAEHVAEGVVGALDDGHEEPGPGVDVAGRHGLGEGAAPRGVEEGEEGAPRGLARLRGGQAGVEAADELRDARDVGGSRGEERAPGLLDQGPVGGGPGLPVRGEVGVGGRDAVHGGTTLRSTGEVRPLADRVDRGRAPWFIRPVGVPRLTEPFEAHSYAVDAFGLLSAPALSGWLQEAAGRHADRLGVGVEALQARGLTWVLARQVVVVDRPVAFGECAEVVTWPSGADRLSALRDFEVRVAGEARARAVTQWIVLDLATRKPVRPGFGPAVRARRADGPRPAAPVRAPRRPRPAGGGAPASPPGIATSIGTCTSPTRATSSGPARRSRRRAGGPGGSAPSRPSSSPSAGTAAASSRVRQAAGDGVFVHSVVREEDQKELARLRTSWVDR